MPGSVLGIIEPKMIKVKSLLFRRGPRIRIRQVNKSLGYWVLVTDKEYQTELLKSACGMCPGVGGGATVVFWKAFLERKQGI